MKLTDEEIEKIALKARQSYGVQNAEHVDYDFDLYLEKSGAVIVPGKGLLDEIGIDSFWTKGFKELHIDLEIYQGASNRWRFSIAHEIGHLFLHKDKEENLTIEEWQVFQLKRYEDRNIQEQEANTFASYFLISTECLQKEINDLLRLEEVKSFKIAGESNKEISERFSSKLAGVFHVSLLAMEIRLERYWNNR